MRGEAFGAKPTTRWLFLVLLFAAIRTTAHQSVQSPRCAGVIQGVVTDNAGQPVRGFEVIAFPLDISLGLALPRVRTDESGKYRFAQLCPLKYTVLPHDRSTGYPRDMSPELFEFLYGRHVSEVRLTPEHLSAEISFQLPPKPGRIDLRVTNRTNQVEVNEFTVQLIVPGQRPEPRMEFQFYDHVGVGDVPVPPDKDFILRITAHGFHDWSASPNGHQLFHLHAGAHLTLEAQLQPLR